MLVRLGARVSANGAFGRHDRQDRTGMQRLKRMTAWYSYAEQRESYHVFKVAGPA